MGAPGCWAPVRQQPWVCILIPSKLHTPLNHYKSAVVVVVAAAAVVISYYIFQRTINKILVRTQRQIIDALAPIICDLTSLWQWLHVFV